MVGVNPGEEDRERKDRQKSEFLILVIVNTYNTYKEKRIANTVNCQYV